MNTLTWIILNSMNCEYIYSHLNFAFAIGTDHCSPEVASSKNLFLPCHAQLIYVNETLQSNRVTNDCDRQNPLAWRGNSKCRNIKMQFLRKSKKMKRSRIWSWLVLTGEPNDFASGLLVNIYQAQLVTG